MKIQFKKLSPIILAMILLLSFGLRLYHLGRPSLWLDETGTAARAGLSWGETIKDMRDKHEGNPAGYYFLISLWSRSFGESEFALRFPSLIFSLLSVLMAYLLTRSLFSEKAGLIAAFLLCISPYSINYAQEARMYAQFWFLGTVSFFMLYRFIRTGSLFYLAISSLANLLAIYTSYAGVFYFFIQAVIVLTINNKSFFKKWILAQLIILTLFLPNLIFLLQRGIPGTAITWIDKKISYHDLFFGIICYLSGDLKGYCTGRIFLLYGPWLILGFLTFPGKRVRLKFTGEDFFIWSWMLIPLIIGVSLNLVIYPFLSCLTIRYIGFIHIPFLIAVSKGLSNIPFRLCIAVIAILTLITFGKYLIPYYMNDAKISGENWRGLFSQLGRTAKPDDLIVLSVGTSLPYKYYNPDPRVKTRFIHSMENIKFKPGYNSVFVLYRQWKQRYHFKELPGYIRTEHFKFGNIGFYKFNRAVEG